MINYHKNFTVTFAGVRGVHPCHGSLWRQHCVCSHISTAHRDAACSRYLWCRIWYNCFWQIFDPTRACARIFVSFTHSPGSHHRHSLLCSFLEAWMESPHVRRVFRWARRGHGIFEEAHCAPLFPISFTPFPAQILLQDISAYTTVPRPGFEVTTFPLNHPGGALGYRLNFQHYVML